MAVQERVIMCGPYPVLSFPFDQRTGRAAGTGTVLDRARLPLELTTHGKLAVYARRIDMWWRRRAIPSTRDGIRRALDLLGVRSTVDLLDRSYGLGLSDLYWVKPVDDPACWEDVNFFTNPFDEELGRTLLDGVSSSHRFSFNVPDASTGGDLPKRWTVARDGTRVLVKGGRTGQEPVNETIASALAARLGIPAVQYRLGEYRNRPVSLCADMLDGREELVSAWQVLGSVKRDNRLSLRDEWVRDASGFGCDRDAVAWATDDWLLVDWLMRNTDRHFNNFGLIRDVDTLRVRPAPLFDTGESLWCGELRVDNGDYRAKPFYATPKSPTARRQLRLVSDWSRFDLSRLADWPDEAAHRLSATGMLAPARIGLIRDALMARTGFALRVRDETARRLVQGVDAASLHAGPAPIPPDPAPGTVSGRAACPGNGIGI